MSKEMSDYELRDMQVSFLSHLKYPHQPDPREAGRIREKLAEHGFDPNDDASYELVEPGLTKAKFDAYEFLAKTHRVTADFHSSQNLRWQTYSEYVPGSRYRSVEQMMRTIKHYADDFKTGTMPVDADPYHRATFDMIMDDYKSGKLKSYFNDLAVGYAAQERKNLDTAWESAQKIIAQKLAKGERVFVEDDTKHVRGTLRTLDELLPQMDSAHRARYRAESGDKPGSVKKIRGEMAIVFARESVRNGDIIPKWEPINLCYQRALEEMDKAGIDIHAESTYKAIEMDRKIFWDNYRAQIDWLRGEGKIYGLPNKIYEPKP